MASCGIIAVTTIEENVFMKDQKSEKKRDPYDGLRPWSAITHGIGAALSAVALVLLPVRFASLGTLPCFSVVLYAVTMISLYTASTVYHSWRSGVKVRILLRKIDHLMIYLLIAGTYTPVCLIRLRGTPYGLPLLIAIWTMAAVGGIFTLFWIGMPRFLSSLIYILMGWVVLFAIIPLYHAMDGTEFIYLLAGGVTYSVGGILYALKWPGRDNPVFGCHEIFHVFIVLGSILHFLMIWHFYD